MPWKRGNPGCSCCESLCACAPPVTGMPNLTHAPIAGTGSGFAVKVEIWDLPSLIEWTYIDTLYLAGWYYYAEGRVENADALNGTHYIELLSDAPCASNIDQPDGTIFSLTNTTFPALPRYQSTINGTRVIGDCSLTTGALIRNNANSTNSLSVRIDRSPANNLKLHVSMGGTYTIHGLSPRARWGGLKLALPPLVCTDNFARQEDNIRMNIGYTNVAPFGCTLDITQWDEIDNVNIIDDEGLIVLPGKMSAELVRI